ncbi:hypothetical protein [Paraburkholderia sp. J12]|uniref:hypothetical protein n=1 Tax=Paraburkholderia sp. J12 TaxID=2805432 RepID=UPI002ABD6C18|nr:hypothetical protein [Paraburkholderia sp. J12]
MRKLLNSRIACGVLAVGSSAYLALAPATAAAQDATDASACRNVTGTVDIDGSPQQISGLACPQPDGTWQIQQGGDGTLLYPVLAPADYYGPWYGWWPTAIVGVSFVFVDRFHHFYPIHRVYYGHPGMRPVSGTHGGFHSGFHSGMMWGGGGHHR